MAIFDLNAEQRSETGLKTFFVDPDAWFIACKRWCAPSCIGCWPTLSSDEKQGKIENQNSCFRCSLAIIVLEGCLMSSTIRIDIILLSSAYDILRRQQKSQR